ncbi:MAG: hypothetical protein P4L33_22055 [Capsulimonadaceae bacterium]|nr:hypothetical protein [Capsulimonadaceae bacterium]
MNKQLVISFAILAIAAAGAMAYAADAASTSATSDATPAVVQSVHKHPNTMNVFEQLNLTDAQKAQVKQILTDAKTQAKAAKDDTSLSPADLKTKVGQIHKDAQAAILALLTDEQKAKLKQIRETQGAAASEAKLSGNLDYLNLTESQKDQLTKITGEAKDSVAAINADTTLANDQKTAKITDIRAAAFKQFASLLTPAQKKLWVAHQHAVKTTSAPATTP